MCTSFRNAALLAKMAGTLDHLSDGRLILGIGCGWHDPEYEAFGYPTDHKVGRFEESLTIIRSLIRDGRADLDGRWMTAKDAVLVPPARPDLPILIAAKRPRMLELTARHADAWNLAWFGAPDERWRGARAELDGGLRRRRPRSGEPRADGRRQRALPGPGRGSGAAGTTSIGRRRWPRRTAAARERSSALRGDDEIAAGLAAYADEGTGHAHRGPRADDARGRRPAGRDGAGRALRTRVESA